MKFILSLVLLLACSVSTFAQPVALRATNGSAFNLTVNNQTNTDLNASKIVLTGPGKKLISSAFGESDLSTLASDTNYIARNAGKGTNTTIYGDVNATNALTVTSSGVTISNAVASNIISGNGSVINGVNITNAVITATQIRNNNDLTIGPNTASTALFFTAGGTGIRWLINGSGHFVAGVDNTYDIGVAGATRPRTLYLGSNLVQQAGAVISLASGTNQRAGNTTLVGGTITVANTTVTANTIVMLTRKTTGGTIGTAVTYTLSPGTSFTFSTDNILDTSTFSYLLLEVP